MKYVIFTFLLVLNLQSKEMPNSRFGQKTIGNLHSKQPFLRGAKPLEELFLIKKIFNDGNFNDKELLYSEYMKAPSRPMFDAFIRLIDFYGGYNLNYDAIILKKFEHYKYRAYDHNRLMSYFGDLYKNDFDPLKGSSTTSLARVIDYLELNGPMLSYLLKKTVYDNEVYFFKQLSYSRNVDKYLTKIKSRKVLNIDYQYLSYLKCLKFSPNHSSQEVDLNYFSSAEFYSSPLRKAIEKEEQAIRSIYEMRKAFLKEDRVLSGFYFTAFTENDYIHLGDLMYLYDYESIPQIIGEFIEITPKECFLTAMKKCVNNVRELERNIPDVWKGKSESYFNKKDKYVISSLIVYSLICDEKDVDKIYNLIRVNKNDEVARRAIFSLGLINTKISKTMLINLLQDNKNGFIYLSNKNILYINKFLSVDNTGRLDLEYEP